MINLEKKIQKAKKLLETIKEKGGGAPDLEERLIQCIVQSGGTKEDDEMTEKIITKGIAHTGKNPVIIKTAVGLTIALKEKYTFARVEASIEIPCDEKDINTTFSKGWKIVEDELSKETKDIVKEKGTGISVSGRKDIPTIE